MTNVQAVCSQWQKAIDTCSNEDLVGLIINECIPELEDAIKKSQGSSVGEKIPHLMKVCKYLHANTFTNLEEVQPTVDSPEWDKESLNRKSVLEIFNVQTVKELLEKFQPAPIKVGPNLGGTFSVCDLCQSPLTGDKVGVGCAFHRFHPTCLGLLQSHHPNECIICRNVGI